MERGRSELRVRLRTPAQSRTSSTSTLTGSSPGLLAPAPTNRHRSPCHSRNAMCSRIRGDFGRHTIQIAPTPAVASTSADTTVSTRRGIHHGCTSSRASARLTTPRKKVSHRGPVHTASPHACMGLRYPARGDIKPQAAGATTHNPPIKRALRNPAQRPAHTATASSRGNTAGKSTTVPTTPHDASQGPSPPSCTRPNFNATPSSCHDRQPIPAADCEPVEARRHVRCGKTGNREASYPKSCSPRCPAKSRHSSPSGSAGQTAAMAIS